MNRLPGTKYVVDFFANSNAHATGQGQRYLGSALVTTDASGNVSFDLTLPAKTTAGEWLTATATDPDGNTSEFSARLQSKPVPATVAGIVVNDGAAQRSMVTSFTVTFNGIVTIDTGAFELSQQGGGKVPLVVGAVSYVGNTTVVKVTFAGAGIVGGSLSDGRYNLIIQAKKVHDRFGQNLDGDKNGLEGGNASFKNALFRVFGDSNGNGIVDARDLAAFRHSFGKHAGQPRYLAHFDYNGNGNIHAADYAQFHLRHGSHI